MDKKYIKIHTRYFGLMLCLVLAAATFGIYWQVTNHDFVSFDDNVYVTQNAHVQAGVTKKNVIWAFTTLDANFWHPLTWLSHMLDYELFGLDAGMHHLTNLLFHIANTLLLFWVIKRMTGALWQSAFVAALFALHPLHVESVAWISERKDVVSTLFWMLTMWAYVRYTERPGVNRYLLILFFFALGLMSKPMIVTLPFVLLLTDYWPLGRFKRAQEDKVNGPNLTSFSPFRVICEKIPLLALAAVFSVVAFFAQGDAVQSPGEFPFKFRIYNALVSYLSYIKKMFWPTDLSVFYPYPKIIPLWQVAGSGLLLLFLSVVVIRMAKRHPYLSVGWFWYLGTLVPVIGLVQVGAHAMADRYTYIPLIGLFVIIAWGIPDLLRKWPHRKPALAILAGLVLSVFVVFAWLQARHWKDSISLFTHAIDVTTDNWLAHNDLGFPLAQQGRNSDAIRHFSEALRIKPDYWEGHVNLGNTLALVGRLEEAMNHFREALRINPENFEAHRMLGTVLGIQGKFEAAVNHLDKALQINPTDQETQKNLKIALEKMGKQENADRRYREVLENDPNNEEAHMQLARLFETQDRFDDAIKHYKEAIRIDPENPNAHYNLGNILARQGAYEEAITHYMRVLRVNPDSADTHNNLGIVLARKGNLEKAVKHYSESLRIDPGSVRAHYNLGTVFERKGRLKEAAKHYNDSLRIDPNLEAARRRLEIVTRRIENRQKGSP
jgi:tetratricopeptide (TPR) repeat protein